ncbi:S41 family peptidase [Ponticaulis sp.]|uniref:S41 family peptidase n=1 Tax=Ponticaulis sp. TaxID=2020902 RepID=UPI000B64EDFF|nr:S41 family peptidase [Ponticaulis sp.]MAI91852.1 peptidase S41 [Ponticaulis sp.]OUX96536.1 MAG: peptidase S41 [Hyphomonadaceae bacterium TMED5]|tara:strand:- start:9418 stop:10746 length:1329 start_codon:yes stop_codon:yes gene_type:complete
MRSWLMSTVVGAAALGFTAVGVTSLAWSANSTNSEREEVYQQLDLFAEILARVDTEYVIDVDQSDAMENAINGMLASLDPHSSYLPASAYEDMQEQTSGEYGGLGIEVSSFEGYVKIVSPIDDSPAARADLRSGDLISAIDGVSIVGKTLEDAISGMRGEVGTDIVITVIRAGEDEPFDVTLTREIIRPKSVVHEVMEEDIGYVRISAFNERTTELLAESLSALETELGNHPAGLILDLRNNPGGLLDQAISVSSMFLDSGEVVSTRGRDPRDIQRYNATRGERFAEVPIMVLINGGSASAAEIVAGALQDMERAQILGMTSFGKGSVQTVIPLSAQRGALRLTTARYYTPSGRSIQATGIEPDFEVAQYHITEDQLEDMRRFSEADLPNALDNDSGSERVEIHMPADMPAEDYEGEDYQLERAIEQLRTITLSSVDHATSG